MIPEAIIQRTRDATDIVELISGYVKLKKRGQNYVGLCPFHSEKTPSFSVNPARQIFHCFGCGAGGDVFRFVERAERFERGTGALELEVRADHVDDVAAEADLFESALWDDARHGGV